MAALGCGDDDDDGVAAIDAGAPDAAPLIDAAPTIDGTPPPDGPPPLLGNSCVSPFETTEPLISDTQDTAADFTNAFISTCSLGTNGAPDTVYKIPVGKTPIDLIATLTVDDSADPPFDAVLSARMLCQNSNTELACSDTGIGERLEVLGAVDDVFLIVDGTNQFGLANAGSYDLETTTRAIVGDAATCDPAAETSRCAEGFRCVGATCGAETAELACTQAIDLTASLAGGATATVTGTTQLFERSFFAGSCANDASAPFTEHLYTFTVSTTSTLDATTDAPATNFDTVLYLVADACDGVEQGCHDDVDVTTFNLRSHLVVPSLAPGTYYLVVDGSSDSPGTGSYSLSVTLTAD